MNSSRAVRAGPAPHFARVACARLVARFGASARKRETCPAKPLEARESNHAAPGVSTAQSDEPIKPILPEPEPKLDARKVALGDKLFHDKHLSKDNSMSCAGCHDLARGGVDGTPSSTGIGGVKGTINAPTVFNSSRTIRQFWDGRAATLEEQAAGPVHNPKEMGSNWAEVLGKLTQDAALVGEFKASYPDGLQAKNIQDAIATFERSLTTLEPRQQRARLP